MAKIVLVKLPCYIIAEILKKNSGNDVEFWYEASRDAGEKYREKTSNLDT